MILIQPLTKSHLQEAGEMANKVFPDTEVPPMIGLEACLDRKVVERLNSEHGGQFNWLKYWTAFDDDLNKITGVVGVYEEFEDAETACWLGWYCVDPTFRNKGIGTLLLAYAINETKKLHKRYLRLYTSTNPSRSVAQKMYENTGFKIMKNQPRKKDNKHEIIYLELDLKFCRVE